MNSSLISWKVFIIIILAAATIYALFQRVNNASIAPKETVKQWIADKALIVDVRTEQEFNSGNYPGAINIPLAEIGRNLEKFGSKDRKIIVYCRSGNRSSKAKKILESEGFAGVINGGGLRDMP